MEEGEESLIGVHVPADLLEDCLVAVMFTQQETEDIETDADWGEVEERLKERINKLPSSSEHVDAPSNAQIR